MSLHERPEIEHAALHFHTLYADLPEADILYKDNQTGAFQYDLTLLILAHKQWSGADAEAWLLASPRKIEGNYNSQEGASGGGQACSEFKDS
jgi:hypothetical protein